MRRSLAIACGLWIGLASMTALGAPGGGSGSSDMPAARPMSPQEEAQQAFRDGSRSVKQADKYGQSALEAKDEGKRNKARERAHKQYGKARESFVFAIQRMPKMHEAWNMIGYTSRKLGEYDKALAAYDEALRLKPDYLEAIEYRGEAYLGLGRVDDAKGAYLALFSGSRELADRMMTAMHSWVAARRTAPGNISSEQVEALATWLEQRTTVAQQTTAFAAPDVDAPARW
jgi:tetratricopeptide (TPR) repeat protein